MELLSGTLSLCTSFTLYVYLYGLEKIDSAAFNEVFYFFPFVLFCLSIYSFYMYYKKN